MRSALVRGIDLRMPSNAFAVAAFAVASVLGVAMAARDGGSLLTAGRAGIGLGFAVFLAWVLARELDPDHSLTATLATIATLPLATAGTPQDLPLLAGAIAARVVSGSNGQSITRTDVVVVGLLAGLAARVPIGLVAGVVLIVGALATARLAPGDSRRLELAAGLGAGATGIAVAVQFALDSYGLTWQAPQPWQWAMIALSTVVGALAVARTPLPFSLCDAPAGRGARRAHIDRIRLRAARGLTVVWALGSVAQLGSTALEQLPGLYATLLMLPAGALLTRTVRQQ